MRMSPLRLAMIGLDTSHATAFTELLHDRAHPHHVEGARVLSALPGGSPDFALSIDRVAGFTRELQQTYSVAMVTSIAALAGECDAVLLESVDGRVHREQFAEVAEWGVPVFIDKPLAITSGDAAAIADLAARRRVPVMTASALRFATPLCDVLNDRSGGAVIGADMYGPMLLQEKSPGYFWYGIHAAEMLYATLGQGCRSVEARRSGDIDIIIATWKGGRTGTIRGNRTGNGSFGGTVHRETSSRAFDVAKAGKPFYASLLEVVIPFLQGGVAPVPMDESVEIIRFLEAANESLERHASVTL